MLHNVAQPPLPQVREAGPMLQGPDCALGVRVVRRGVRPRVGLRDAEIRQVQFEQHARIDVDPPESAAGSNVLQDARQINPLRNAGDPAPGLGTFRCGNRTFLAIASRASTSSSESAGSPRTGGGASCATTRPRSVTSTVSPSATIRRYSLNLFLTSQTPAALMHKM